MFYIKMKPRAYRVVPIITACGGFPIKRYQLQCQTRLGWGAMHLFHSSDEAYAALIDWRKTLS